MSTADTINSIRTHLTADYESLENIGAELENVDKNIENIASVVNGIYDNLPKTTGEDTNLSLNTLKGKMNIQVKGDTEQDSATGSNLMNTEKLVNGTYNGLTITKDSDDFINISGTATANTTIVLSEITYNFPSELYISYENNFTTSTAQLSFLNGNTALGGLTFSGANRTYNMSTILGGKTCTRIELYVTSGNTINGKFRPMLNTQSGQTYSKYAFPNPSFPSDIEVVTGTQEVKVENVNLLNYSKFVKGRINSSTGQIEYASNTSNISTTENTISFTTTQAWNSGIASEFMPIDQGSYTYSIKSATLKANVYIYLYDKDQNFISRLGNKVINVNEQTTWQVTISNTSAKYIRLHYEMGYADTITLTETQLEKRKYCYTIYTTPRTNTNSKSRRYRTM